MYTIHLQLAIELQSKWHCGSGEGGLATNRSVMRDSKKWPYIPASTLRGIVRENCEKLSRTLLFPPPNDPHEYDLTRSNPGAFRPASSIHSPVDALFGSRYEEGGIFFRDARLTGHPGRDSLIQSRICRYRMLGTARHGHLFSTEYILPQIFDTTLDGYHRDLICFGDADPPFAYCLLIAGILNVDRLGADKSTGCGQATIRIASATLNGTPFEPERAFEYLTLSSLYGELLEQRKDT